jgi:propanol-preferring alcohol dehydrogenase
MIPFSHLPIVRKSTLHGTYQGKDGIFEEQWNEEVATGHESHGNGICRRAWKGPGMSDLSLKRAVKSWVLHDPGPMGPNRLSLEERLQPPLASAEVRLRMEACALCRTDLHIIEGEIPSHRLPLVLGHQIVGQVIEVGEDVQGLAIGQRVGVPWLAGTDGSCPSCRQGRENLCPSAQFTGYDQDGGYAQEAVARAAFTFPLPFHWNSLHAAPLLCGGAIGFRALRLAALEPGEPLALYGFGSSAHMILQLAVALGHPTLVRSRGPERLQLAHRLGAAWVGDYTQPFPQRVAAGLVFAPAGEIVPSALADLEPGGRLVLAGIQMSAIPSFPYRLLYQERSLQSVANSTRADVSDFLRLADEHHLAPEAEGIPFGELPEALIRLKEGRFTGSLVLLAGNSCSFRPARGGGVSRKGQRHPSGELLAVQEETLEPSLALQRERSKEGGG